MRHSTERVSATRLDYIFCRYLLSLVSEFKALPMSAKKKHAQLGKLEGLAGKIKVIC